MIKAVLFDYGGVLSPGGKSIKNVYAALFDIPEDQIDLKAIRHGDFRSGKISSDEFFTNLSKIYGRQVTADEFSKSSDIFVRSHGVYDLAQELRKNGIQTGILSNIYDVSADILKRDDFYKDFDPIILSYEVGYAKPDPEIYQIATERLGVKPDQVLFIDDQEKCLPPARQLGMHVIRADNEEQIVTDTKALFKKENGLEL
jgi:putative hydrolase of the HAD superfamily